MKFKATPAQQAKIKAARLYFMKSTEPDKLYHVVVIIGPGSIGTLIGGNSDTVWSKIENPNNFRMRDIDAYSSLLGISFQEVTNEIKKLLEFNKEERRRNRPIGRLRYQTPERENKTKK